MTPPDRAALREAVEVALSWMPSSRSLEAQTLRAWLDSGLSDDERETVGKVVAEMASRIVWPVGEPSMLNAEVAAWLEALRPIASGSYIK